MAVDPRPLRAAGPQFFFWLPPGALPEIDLTGETGTLQVLLVDESGAPHAQRENILCGGKAKLPQPDDKHGTFYWLRPAL